MKTISLIILFANISFQLIAQGVSISENGNPPHPSAILDLQSNNKGLLMPRIQLTSKLNPAPLSSHVEGMTVYNTAVGIDVTPGFYYNNGISWIKVAEDADNSMHGYDIGYIVGWTSNVTPPNYLLPVSGGTYNWSDYPYLKNLHDQSPIEFILSSTQTTFTLKNINDERVLRGSTQVGSMGGSNSVLITQENLPNVTLTTQSSGSHTHTMLSAGEHTHTMSSAGEHTHTHNATGQPGAYGLIQSSSGGNNTSNGQNVDQTIGEPNLFATPNALSIQNSGSHTHEVQSSGSHTHELSSSGSHTHTVPLGGAGQPIDIQQAYIDVTWCLKVQPTSTTGNIIISSNNSISGISLTPMNGLQINGTNVGLGGQLSQNTTINLNNNNLVFQGNGQVIIGNSQGSNPSAALALNSTEQGFLPPRLTNEQRNSIQSPAIGLIIFNTTTNCLNMYKSSGVWFELCGSATFGTITSLNCSQAINNGYLVVGQSANGVSSVIPYLNGNGNGHNGQSVTSTGVTGLTATLSSGNFQMGSGNLTYIITGVPNQVGNAQFLLNIGGQSCTLTVPVIQGLVTNSCNPSKPTIIADVVNPVTGRTWMDRNLGADQKATSQTDVMAYGFPYQWGRGSDGHQCVPRYTGHGFMMSSVTSTLSSSNSPGHGSFIIIGNAYAPVDWRSPQNNSLWQGVNGINNPCPSGYRLPTSGEWESERQSWTQSPISSSNNASGAFASPLKLTRAGSRLNDTSNTSEVGTTGYYWSSSISSGGTNSAALTFDSTTATVTVYVRAAGMNVRCIKN